ncbi:hypothetical protein BCV69DRAFT_281574 [Microstroma glucosiphilum]|uniref:Uncharacterized protein n=1 Tax=Pseudomicrostroma glucosiphilum TaxID=1684307 RepID=A0A316UBP8_9BASI|nr:hypothetical protein BCV69DRAFT_281574 [Pseudomicrostroma glucosiphilum]PWN22589.1 hypothetical protein BCV69DRAFT_281574 [Pseudomicrostroma glucosiphilum]
MDDALDPGATDGPSTLPHSQAQRLTVSLSRAATDRSSSAPPDIDDLSPTSLSETSQGEPSGHPARTILSYPSPDFQSKTNQKPFSHSAAKRESVMALGSIAGFQKFYARQGLAAPSPPMATKGGRLALGPAAAAARGGSLPPPCTIDSGHQQGSSNIGEQSRVVNQSQRGAESNIVEEAPRSTWKGKLFPDVARPVEADLEGLRKVMTACLEVTRQQWLLTDPVTASKLAAGLDIAELVATSIKTVRAVRSYFLALPPQSLVSPSRQKSRSAFSRLRRQQSFCQEGAQPKPRDNFKRQSMSHILTRRASTVLLSSGFAAPGAENSPSGRRSSSRAPSSFLPFQTVRRMSYAPTETGRGEDVASRNLARDIKSIFAATEAMAHSASGRASTMDFRSDRSASPASSDDEEGTSNASAADPLVLIRAVGLEVLGMLKQLEDRNRVSDAAAGATGDEKGHSPGEGAKIAQYRTDVSLAALTKEREVVRTYVVEVEAILDRLPYESRKRERGQRAASYSGATEVSEMKGLHLGVEGHPNLFGYAPKGDDDHVSDGSEGNDNLPKWARTAYDEDNLGRARALLCDVLPGVYPELRPTVESDQLAEATHEGLLMALSDGQLLCHAFNAALRRSSKPWGFIPSGSIHDVRADEDHCIPSRSRSVNASHTSSTGRHTPSEIGEEMDSTTSSLGDIHRKPGWTFRRVENLNKFTVAIALRYGIKSGRVKDGASQQHSNLDGNVLSDHPLMFDAVKVVRQEGDWQEMLRRVVEQWALKVAEEERNR